MLKSVIHALDPTTDAISLLKDDHRKVEALFKDYEAAQDKRGKGSIAQQICKELELHTKLEESVFYPAARREVADARSELNEAVVEHAAVKKLVKEVQRLSPADEMFDAKVTVIMEFVKHHVREEESEMFPKITESDLDLKALGERLIQTKKRLQQGGQAKGGQVRGASRSQTASRGANGRARPGRAHASSRAHSAA